MSLNSSVTNKSVTWISEHTRSPLLAHLNTVIKQSNHPLSALMSFVSVNQTICLSVLGACAVVYLFVSKMFGHDPREPPLAPQSIPFIGHMVGLSRSKFNYYVQLRYALLTSDLQGFI